jgi:hypothetical protein
MRALVVRVACIFLMLAAACGSSTPKAIGEPCSDSEPCSTGNYCYKSTGTTDAPLNNICTRSCTGVFDSDTCKAADSAAVCLTNGVCGRRCSAGCLAGTVCNNSSFCARN